MLDLNNLNKYDKSQIDVELNNLKSGYKLYHFVTICMLILSIILFVPSMVFLFLYLFKVVKEIPSNTQYILCIVFSSFCLASIITTITMFLVTRHKFSINIDIIKKYLSKVNK